MQPLDLLLEALGVVAVEPVGNEHHDGALAKHAARPMAVEGAQAGADAGAAGPVHHAFGYLLQGDVDVFLAQLTGDVG